MLIVLSPSKALDTSPKAPPFVSEPVFAEQAFALASTLRGLSAPELAGLMGLSQKLSELNFERFQRFSTGDATPAWFTFDGDTYADIPRDTYTEQELATAQARVRILSGLYGVLRPMDLIEPYRLEMGTKLENERGKNLYAFWGATIAEQLRDDMERLETRALINLASKEYFRAVDLEALDAQVVEPTFRDYKNGAYKVISFYAKRARGMMADHIVRHELTEPAELAGFTGGGYTFDEASSTPLRPVFLRRLET